MESQIHIGMELLFWFPLVVAIRLHDLFDGSIRVHVERALASASGFRGDEVGLDEVHFLSGVDRGNLPHLGDVDQPKKWNKSFD